MTVKELIEKLKEFDEDLEVIFDCEIYINQVTQEVVEDETIISLVY